MPNYLPSIEEQFVMTPIILESFDSPFEPSLRKSSSIRASIKPGRSGLGLRRRKPCVEICDLDIAVDSPPKLIGTTVSRPLFKAQEYAAALN